MNERLERNKALDEAKLLAEAVKSDSFKLFQSKLDELGTDLKNEFVNGYFNLDDKRRKAVDNQAIFISGFNNVLRGIDETVDYYEQQLVLLDEEEKE